MEKNISFKDFAPGFAPIFSHIEQIINADISTRSLFIEAISIMKDALLTKLVGQEKILQFLNLPMNCHYTSSNTLDRMCVLETILMVAIGQASDVNSGNNSFCGSIRNSTLKKCGFDFPDRESIDSFGKEIKTFIPRLHISSHGEGPAKDELYFALFYYYGGTHQSLGAD